MAKKPIQKSYQEINAKIKNGEVVVVTADEMVDIVRAEGPENAARKVDVVTTGTFAPMCSSGAFLNFGHTYQYKCDNNTQMLYYNVLIRRR